MISKYKPAMKKLQAMMLHQYFLRYGDYHASCLRAWKDYKGGKGD